MKKLVRGVIIIALAFLTANVYACELSYEEFKELGIGHAYIVGDYIFDTDYGYSPSLEDFATAARSIPEGEDEYVYDILIDTSGSDAFYVQTEIFSGESELDYNNFPAIDVTYVYRANIRGASEEDYDILTCPNEEDVLEVEYVGLVTEGESEYKSEATRYVNINSSAGVDSAKYCITMGESCIPDTEVSVEGNPAIMEVPYGSEVGEQRVCVEIIDKNGNSTGIICDTETVKVDKEYPSITSTDNYSTIIEGESHDPKELFEVEFGVSGGTINYYYYEPDGTKQLLTNTAELPEGEITVEVMARGDNGLVTREQRVITVRKYVVTYDYTTNGGVSASADELKVGYNGRANLRVTAEKLGYEFLGWSKEPNSKEVLTSLTVDGDITLYAIFSKKLKSEYEIYTVGDTPAVSEFKESSCTIYNNETTCNVEVPVLSARVGFEALGWAEQAGSTAVTYVGGEEITINKNVKYYSVTRKKIGLTGTFHYYDDEDDEVKTQVQRCYPYNGEETCTIEGNPESDPYEGKELAGYTTDKENPQPVDNFDLTSGEDYYAYYEDEYTLTFVSGDNRSVYQEKAHVYFIVDVDGVEKDVEEKYMPAQETIKGFNRIGWRTDTESSEGEYQEGEPIVVDDDTTYYGVYEKNVYLSYTSDEETTNIPETSVGKSYYNSGTGASTTVTFYLDEANEIRKTNYLFSTWTDGVNSYAPGSEFITGEDVTLEAKWELNGIRIVYNYSENGGTRADKSSELYLLESDEGLDVSQVKAYKVGWTFIGWSKSPNATSGAETIIRPNLEAGEEYVLYAMFRKDVVVNFQVQDDIALSLTSAGRTTCTLYNKDTSCNVTLPGVNVLDASYEFIGWNTKSDAITKEYDAGDELAVNETTTYYTVSVNTIPLVSSYIYYDGNNRLVDSVSCYRYNKSSTCETKSEKTGMTYSGGVFTGWSNSEASANPQSTQVISQDTNYYAIYDRILSIKYNSGVNKGTTVTNSVKMNYLATANGIKAIGTSITLETPDAIDGYTTLGWRDDEEATIAKYSAGQSVMVDDDKEYNGVYLKDITLTYDVLNGTPQPQQQSNTVYYNTAIVSAIVPTTFTLADEVTKVGYDFMGWLENGLDGDSYNANSDITVTANTTMYADWKVQQFEVTYDYTSNGGDGVSESTKTFDYASEIDLSVYATRDGYEFVGWSETPDSTEIIDSMTMPAGNITLYAVFRKEVTARWVLVDKAAGTLEKETTNCYMYNNQGSCSIQTGNVIPNDGYSMAGWTDVQGSTEAITGNNIFMNVSEDGIYYSITRSSSPIVGTFYYYEDGIKSAESRCTLYNGEASCEISEPIKLTDYNGGTFVGWSSSEDEYIEASMEISEDTDFYSYFENIISIVYHEGLAEDFESGEGGEEGTENPDAGRVIQTAVRKDIIGKTDITTIYPEVTLKTQDSIPNYTNVGWRTDTTAADKEYSNAQNIILEDSIHLYAVYTRVLTLSYDGNGGSTPNSQTTTQRYNSAGNYTSHTFTLAAAATRRGYTFTNWAMDSVNGTKYNASSSININKDTKMYALWKVNYYDVTLSASKGTFTNTSGGTISKTSVAYDGSVQVRITPNTDWALKSITCTNGYTVSGFTTGYTQTGTQTITIQNNSEAGTGTCTAEFMPACEYSVGQTWTYNYTGGQQTFNLPCTAEYTIEVYGAQGASQSSVSGGLGGSASGDFSSSKGTALYLYVGGQNGYNGGGSTSGTQYNGGGATDVRYGGTGTGNRILVAAGGGGAMAQPVYHVHTDSCYRNQTGTIITKTNTWGDGTWDTQYICNACGTLVGRKGLNHDGSTTNWGNTNAGSTHTCSTRILACGKTTSTIDSYTYHEGYGTSSSNGTLYQGSNGGGGGYYGGNARYAGTNYVNGSYLSNGSNSYGVNSGNGRVVIRLKALPE